jgi:hypothetical protein
MTLKLHQKCKEQLINVLKEQLPKITVSNRKFLDRKSAIYLFFAEKVLPESGDLKINLARFIGESPVYDFIYETLVRELSEQQKYDSESVNLELTKLAEYENPEVVATRLVQDFESLPWQYTFTITFHKEISESLLSSIVSKNLSRYMRISRIDESFSKNYPLNSGIEERDRSLAGRSLLSALLIPIENEWEKDSLCLQFTQEGFVGYYGDTETTETVRDNLKAFCGLGIALRLFQVDTKYRPTPTKAKFYIHRQINDEWVVQNTKELDSSISDTFHDLVLHDLDGQLKSKEHHKAWIAEVLDDMSKVFENRSLTAKLLLACQWLFDSYSGRNELLSFVQTTIAIEILLGDKASSDQMGLGVLLRNRCAYLIGSTQSQRDEILKDFQKIYDVRSKIVHGGKSRINFIERSLFRKLQWMCRRVIQEEVKLLKEDLKKKVEP